MKENNSAKSKELKLSSTRFGKSSAKVNFISNAEDLFSEEELTSDSESDDFSEDSLSLSADDTFDEYEDLELEDIINKTTKKESAIISSKIHSLRRDDLTPKKLAKKEINEVAGKLTKKFIGQVSKEESENLLNVSQKQKNDFLSGNFDFTARKDITQSEKKELFEKLEQITSTVDVEQANSAFVLKWLKNRDEKR